MCQKSCRLGVTMARDMLQAYRQLSGDVQTPKHGDQQLRDRTQPAGTLCAGCAEAGGSWLYWPQSRGPTPSNTLAPCDEGKTKAKAKATSTPSSDSSQRFRTSVPRDELREPEDSTASEKPNGATRCTGSAQPCGRQHGRRDAGVDATTHAINSMPCSRRLSAYAILVFGCIPRILVELLTDDPPLAPHIP